jgi:hypothetical protein
MIAGSIGLEGVARSRIVYAQRLLDLGRPAILRQITARALVVDTSERP